MDLGDVNIAKPRKSITAIKDSKYLLSASPKNEEYPSALEYTIYGFIREFIESNVWIEWEQIIPHVIKVVVSKYLRSELIVEAGTTTTLISGVYHEFVSILIGKGGCLTVEPWNSKKQKGGKLLIRVDENVTINEEGQINVNGKGFCGGYFCEQGESFNGKGQKNVKQNNCGGGGGGIGKKSNGYSQCRGAGGGYGSKGNDVTKSKKKANILSHGGSVYGDEYLTVLYLGSGGGGGYNNGISENESGGNGGGVIGIECSGDIILKKDSLICANGGDSVYGGGGSGGSIKLSCAKVTSFDYGKHKDREQSVITAVGGSGGQDKGYRLYAGNGRIRISAKEVNVDLNCILPEPHVDEDYVGDFVE